MSNLINIDESANLSKIELQERGKMDAMSLLDEGFVNALDITAQARKATEYLGAFIKATDSAARMEVAQYGGTRGALGVEFSMGSTGDRINYDLDPIYLELKNKLKAREVLLKVAKNAQENIFDGEGIEVPRLPLKTASREILKAKL